MKEYITAKELQDVTGISYKSSMQIINKTREKMKEKGYYLPQSKTKVALKWMVKKELGIK